MENKVNKTEQQELKNKEFLKKIDLNSNMIIL